MLCACDKNEVRRLNLSAGVKLVLTRKKSKDTFLMDSKCESMNVWLNARDVLLLPRVLEGLCNLVT